MPFKNMGVKDSILRLDEAQQLYEQLGAALGAYYVDGLPGPVVKEPHVCDDWDCEAYSG